AIAGSGPTVAAGAHARRDQKSEESGAAAEAEVHWVFSVLVGVAVCLAPLRRRPGRVGWLLGAARSLTRASISTAAPVRLHRGCAKQVRGRCLVSPILSVSGLYQYTP